jgi:hypothetical protein
MSLRGGVAALVGAALCGLAIWAIAAIDFGLHIPLSRELAGVLFVAVMIAGGVLVLLFDDGRP